MFVVFLLFSCLNALLGYLFTYFSVLGDIAFNDTVFMQLNDVILEVFSHCHKKKEVWIAILVKGAKKGLAS